MDSGEVNLKINYKMKMKSNISENLIDYKGEMRDDRGVLKRKQA